MEKNQVLATVGGKVLTEADVEKVLKSLDPQRAMQFSSEEGKKKLIEELVCQELFYLDAKKNQLDQEDGFLKEVEVLKENLLKQYAINLLLKDIRISQEEARAYYDEHPEQFVDPASVRASHILVEDEAKAEAVLKEIGEGVSFEEAAQKYSKCPSNAKGGDLGFFTRGKMVPEFEEAAFAMATGEISQPVKTQFGSHIIKVVEKKEAATTPFDEIEAQLTQHLLSLKQQKAYYDRVDQLKSLYQAELKL